jgi:F-type H+-transporting ATPase subunit delta
MSVSRISSRYAKSLMELALDRNELEAIKKDILYFTEAIKNRDFIFCSKAPLSMQVKNLALSKLFLEIKWEAQPWLFLKLSSKKAEKCTFLKLLLIL